jgi:hypothetical protein
MRSATRLMIITVLGLFLAFPAVSAAADPIERVADDEAVQTTTAPPPSGTTTTPETAQRIPLDKPETEADQAEDKRKLIMGVTSVVLLGLVIWGRSVRRKRRKATEG